MTNEEQAKKLIAELVRVCDDAGWAMVAGVQMDLGRVVNGRINLKTQPADQLEEIITLMLRNRKL